MSDQADASYFTRAIECLEAGDLDRAEELFKLTIQQLGNQHNQAHLAYKSLISIASEKGEYNRALNVSLDLLDAQINTFGIRHAESSRTINNIYTLCNTLGKHELAKEIMQMAKDAEQKTVASSVKKLRGDQEELLEEEEEKIELPGAQTMIGKITEPVNSLFSIMGKRLKRLVCMIIVLGLGGTIFGALFALQYLEKGRADAVKALARQNYYSADGGISLDFGKGGVAAFEIADKTLELPTSFYSNPAGNIGSLLLTPITSREFWIYKTPQGIDGMGDFTLYGSGSEEMEQIAMMKNIISVANRLYEEQKQYPESFKEGLENERMFVYKNPFTQREDYPVVQQLKLPDRRFQNINQLLAALRTGSTWTNETSLYPGTINCLHVTAETENSFQEKFIIHGCDRYGRLITDASNGTYLLISTGGITEKRTTPIGAAIKGASRVSIIDQSMAGLAPLLKYRLTLFYAFLGILFLGVAKVIPDGLSKGTAGLAAVIFFMIAAVAAFIWYLPI
ncbi:MAG: hypothetical protein R3D26_08470 [Cyanobacteriota/Melainabacteria group bacterium]